MVSTVDTLTIDCADPSRLAAFWTEARRVDEDGSFWTVMLDPEGNEFCVLRGPDDGWSPDA
jgi:hypothetical protein